MNKTILITGATDGIGLETAKMLAGLGHTLLIHGRSDTKLANTRAALSQIENAGRIEIHRADLSRIAHVEALAHEIAEDHPSLDVLINNAGVFNLPDPYTEDGLDLRFMVNTIAPYLLTKRLLPLLSANGRVVNLASAAQAPVDLKALAGTARLADSQAYAQSKLALIMWSFHLADTLAADGPAIISVNPASLLASKMVKEAYGIVGKDLRVGADILVQAAVSEAFASASGKYFDNDGGRFASPHPDALDPRKNEHLVQTIETLLAGAA